MESLAALKGTCSRYRFSNLTTSQVKELLFCPLSKRSEPSSEIEAEQTLVNANRELIERFNKKIEKIIAGVSVNSKESKGLELEIPTVSSELKLILKAGDRVRGRRQRVRKIGTDSNAFKKKLIERIPAHRQTWFHSDSVDNSKDRSA